MILFFRVCPEGVDIVLDPLGGVDTKKGYSLLKPLGILVCFGKSDLVSDILTHNLKVIIIIIIIITMITILLTVQHFQKVVLHLLIHR